MLPGLELARLKVLPLRPSRKPMRPRINVVVAFFSYAVAWSGNMPIIRKQTNNR